MDLYTYPVQSKDVQFNQTETTMVTAALTLRAQARNKWALSVGQEEGAAAAPEGDTVAISEQAKALASRTTTQTGLSAGAQGAQDSDASSAEQAKERIQKRIQEIQQQIRQVQADASLSQEERDKRIQQLQTELMTLMNEMQQQSGGQEYSGGTQAAGFARSLVEKMSQG